MIREVNTVCFKTIRHQDRGFTLIELLVVIAVIALLVMILIPSLRAARCQTQKVICISNLREIGTAIHSYAVNHNDRIPYGPKGLPVMGGNFYTVEGNVTSLISLMNGRPVGLGLLLDGYIDDQPLVLFCPGADQPSEADKQLSRVGSRQAQGDYYYRHGSVDRLVGEGDTSHIRLSNLGKNSRGIQISALAMDVQFLAHPSLESFSVVTRTSHRQKFSNILFADNQVVTHDNTFVPPDDDPSYIPDETEEPFIIDVGISPYDALEKILAVFEKADKL